jgi:hypothetical protein
VHTLALVDAEAGNPVVGALIVVGAIVFFAVWWMVDRERYPNIGCRPCEGTGRRRSSLRSGAWGEHHACSGKGWRSR